MKSNPSTSDLIQSLSQDFSKHKTKSFSSSQFLLYWGMGGALIIALSLWLLPVRQDLLRKFDQPGFLVLNILWLLSAVFMGVRAFQTSFPDARTRTWKRYLDYLPLALLLGWVAFQFPLNDFHYEFMREKNWLNGGCGAVILVAGTLHSFFLMKWLNKGATTHPGHAGAFSALSTGCFASLLIQFACANEHPVHVVIWHLLPLTLLAFLMGTVSQKILKW